MVTSGKQPRAPKQGARSRARKQSSFDPDETDLELEAYKGLQLERGLEQRINYAEAVQELALLLRLGYLSASKSSQAAMYEDTLTAFRNLGSMDGSKHLTAAQNLVRSAEAVFPKQRRAAAISEYKRSALLLHRQKRKQLHGDAEVADEVDEELTDVVQLPPDVVHHVFGYLDAVSLGSAAAVCASWRQLASDDSLWKPHFEEAFGDLGGSYSFSRKFDGEEARSVPGWRRAFYEARKRYPSRVRLTNRAFCTICKQFLWLELCPNGEGQTSKNPRIEGSVEKKHEHSVRPLNASEVVRILLRATNELTSDSDESDEDAMEGGFARLWSFPRIDLAL